MKNNRMLAALMAEYHKAAIEYKQILKDLPQAKFTQILDSKTKDKDCKSVQTITFHIVQSGYSYSNYINIKNNHKAFLYNSEIDTPLKGIKEINKMLDFTEQTLNSISSKTNEEIAKWKFKTSWNVIYDLEQLIEHAIVHILRHRRQVNSLIKTANT